MRFRTDPKDSPWFSCGRRGTSSAAPALLALVLGVACGGSPPRDPAPASPQETPHAETIDRLRSLGYVGFAKPRPSERGAGVVVHEAGTFPGYNFFVNPRMCLAVVMDNAGRPLHTWSARPCDRWSSAELVPTGDLFVTGTYRGRRRFLMKLAWDGTVRWRRPYPAHHDVDEGPDGRLLTLTTVSREIPAVDATTSVYDNEIALLSPDGEPLEVASLYDLFAAAPSLAPLQPIGVDPDNKDIDLFHSNSVERIDPRKGLPGDPFYSPGNVLVCVRHQDRIIMVDWPRRRIVWAWGLGILSGPHDATVLPGGHILVFDNGIARRTSRVLELDPLAGKIVWSYEAPAGETFFTMTRGSNQRLPNGNTLIGESDNGRAFEVTPEGRIVWEFINPLKNRRGERSTFYRMTRLEEHQVGSRLEQTGALHVPPRIAEAFATTTSAPPEPSDTDRY